MPGDVLTKTNRQPAKTSEITGRMGLHEGKGICRHVPGVGLGTFHAC